MRFAGNAADRSAYAGNGGTGEKKMSFTVCESGFQKDKIINFGNKFLTGNGYMGFRGTMEEYGKEELTACNLLGIYDRYKDLWREPINAPNGVYTTLTVGGEAMSLKEREPLSHSQTIDIRRAVHSRETVFESSCGKVTVRAERFVSADDIHVIALRYAFTVEKGGRVSLTTGIDGDVWDINGPHLFEHQLRAEGGTLSVAARTGQLHLDVAVADSVSCNFEAEESIKKTENSIFRVLSFEAEAGNEYTLEKAVAVYTSNDGEADVPAAAWAKAADACGKGYEALKCAHTGVWESRWDVSDVLIEGDDEAQLALRYSLYHLQIIAPHHSDKVSIPARGLSGQTYKGAIFWDTEMFMLPFFLHTDPQVARNLMKYRVDTLDGARKKAQEYGFRGAFYAWESQEDGSDGCSHFNVTDVFTGRPMRTHFRDKQIHISADVAYGLWETYEFTGDESILVDGGAEVILECARFFYSYSYYKDEKKRFEMIDVIGPDEYHERVNNNAYTSKMVAHTVDIAVKTLDLLREKYPEEYRQLIEKLDYEEDIENIRRMRRELYVPQPDPETGIIEQFDGYYQLEDCSLEEVRSRVLDPKEYWGGAYGVAANTRILKQADVVLMLNLFRGEYSQEVKKKNWEYYEPRTEHGSSLSPCIYALLACDVGNQEWGYPYFMKTASVDLTGESKQFAGTIYIGGTHPAANGGAWMAAILGFAGLKVEGGQLSVNPRLPAKWNRLAFKVVLRGQKYSIDITKGETKICKI